MMRPRLSRMLAASFLALGLAGCVYQPAPYYAPAPAYYGPAPAYYGPAPGPSVSFMFRGDDHDHDRHWHHEHDHDHWH
jgi:hypothetical protein